METVNISKIKNDIIEVIEKIFKLTGNESYKNCVYITHHGGTGDNPLRISIRSNSRTEEEFRKKAKEFEKTLSAIPGISAQMENPLTIVCSSSNKKIWILDRNPAHIPKERNTKQETRSMVKPNFSQETVARSDKTIFSEDEVKDVQSQPEKSTSISQQENSDLHINGLGNTNEINENHAVITLKNSEHMSSAGNVTNNSLDTEFVSKRQVEKTLFEALQSLPVQGSMPENFLNKLQKVFEANGIGFYRKDGRITMDGDKILFPIIPFEEIKPFVESIITTSEGKIRGNEE